MSAAVLDTCALLQWTTTAYHLPDDLESGELLIAAISWCEIAWKHRLGKLPLPGGLDAWRRAVDELRLIEVAIDRDLFLQAVALDWGHRDPADRVIVALAEREQLPIVTCDDTIRQRYDRCCW